MTHKMIYDSSDVIKSFNYFQLFLPIKNFVYRKDLKVLELSEGCYYDRL
jgi:hypothetical protein